MSIRFEDLPDEIVLNVPQLLEHKDVSPRRSCFRKLHTLGTDNNLWYEASFALIHFLICFVLRYL